MSDFLLTDVEMDKIWRDAWQTKPQSPAELGLTGVRMIAQAQLDKAEPLIRADERRKLVEWGDEICPHGAAASSGHFYITYRRECLKCWQTLRREAGKEGGMIKCPNCDGTGVVDDETCSYCDGEKEIAERK